MWLFFTLLAALLWGVGQVLTKKGLEETTPLFNNLLAAAVTLIITIPFTMLNGANLWLVPKMLPLTLLIALLLICYYYILEKGQVSLTGTVLASYPLFTIVLSLFILHEHPSIFQVVAIILIILGTITIATGEHISAFRQLRFGEWFGIAIAGALSIGVSDFLAKVAINNSDTYTYILAYGISFPIVAVLSYFFDKKGRKFSNITNRKFLPTIIGVTMIEIGMIAYYIAIAKGLVSVVTPLSSIYVAITAILAWLFLKDKINKIQFFGIVFSVCGIVLIGIG